ncbi:hypothetical protein RCO48_28280 [Peribacillus frigoritolerans]|nr:hypothetical protein [Peribacillus frigoritolerans]
MENSERRWVPTRTVTLDELVSSIVSKGRQAMLTGIYVYGDPESGSNVTNAQYLAEIRFAIGLSWSIQEG